MNKISELIVFLLFIFIIMGSSVTASAGDKKDEGIYRRTADSFWSLTYKVGGAFKDGYKSIAGYFRTESPKIKDHSREIKEDIKKTNENIGKAFKEAGKEIKEKNEKIKNELKKK